MSVTREVPMQEWPSFLPDLVERNVGAPVRLETGVAEGEGSPVLVENQPLLGIDMDEKGSDAPDITISVGGLQAGRPSFTHVVERPTHLWVKEQPDGPTEALEIESDEEGRTLVIFEAPSSQERVTA